MKKHLLLACMLLAGSLAASAQDDVPPPPARSGRIDVNRIRFGAFVAPNISWMKPTAGTDDAKRFDVKSQGSKIGFTYGLMMDYFFAANYGLVSGLSVTSTGGKILATARDQTTRSPNRVLKADFDYRLQYLNIPLALKLRTDEINGFRFFGQAGITAAINIGKKADYTVSYYDTALAQREASDSKAKLTGSFGIIAPVLFEMNLGIGLEKPVSQKLRFYAGLFFNNGFTPDATRPDLFDEGNLGYAGSFDDAKTRLNNFALRLGLFF